LRQPPAEFGLIARHFRPLAGPGGLDLLDDAALMTPPPGRELVLTADAMVAGVHFLPDDPPDQIGQKLLRVNLSDLAAMGAAPLAYLMTVSAPRATPDGWFACFAAGLARDQTRYGIMLLGGDTTSTPGPISLSLTCIGHVAPGQAIRRRGAMPGDEIWVTGTIGDGALGLAALQGRLADPDGVLTARYRLPQPRLGLLRQGLVHAAMDVSDGLVQDLGHLARAGGVRALLDAVAVPLSAAARAAGPAWLEVCLTGGDDYELLIAAPAASAAPLQAAAASLGVAIVRIGRFVAGDGVRVQDAAGAEMALPAAGWSHF
jgi:thiamine-monophosphate kinase